MIKRYRQRKGLTQQQLADELGVSRSNIASIESGISKPSVSLAKKIGKRLGLNWINLFK